MYFLADPAGRTACLLLFYDPDLLFQVSRYGLA